MRTLPPPVVIDTRSEPPPERPPWVRFAMAFAAGALLGGIAVGVRGASTTQTTEAAPPTEATAASEATTTTREEATATTVEELIPLATALRSPLFDAQTYNDDDLTVLPVVFPDGTSMELLFPRRVVLSLNRLTAATSGSVGDAPARNITLIPVDIDDIDWPLPPWEVLDGGVTEARRYSAGDPAETWLAFDFRGWTVLVADDPLQPMGQDEQAGWLEGLDAHVVSSGFIVLEATAPLRLAAAGDPGGPALTFGEELRQLVVRTGACPVSEASVLCVVDAPVYFEVVGGGNVIADLAGATRVRALAAASSAEHATILDVGIALSAFSLEDFEITANGTILGLGWPPDGWQRMIRSSDGGRTWMQQPLPGHEPDQVTSLVAPPSGGVLAATVEWGDPVVADAGRLWRSTDDGISWRMSDWGGLLTSPSVGVTGTGEVFVLGASCADVQACTWSLSQSSDGGETFSNVHTILTGQTGPDDYLQLSAIGDGVLAVHGTTCDMPSEPDAMLCAPFLASSDDAGSTWSPNVFPGDQPADDGFVARVVLSNSGSLFASGFGCDQTGGNCGPKVWVVQPDGNAGELQATGAVPALETVLQTRDGTLIGGGPGIFVSTDGGTEWSEAATPASGSTVFLGTLAESPEGTLYAAGATIRGFLWRSDDGGHTWVHVTASG